MADGNLGSLWMSLGLKDATSSALKKIQQELSGTDDKAKKVQDAIKEIQKGLKSDNSAAFGGALNKLSELLKKSKSEAKDLSVVLDSLGKKGGIHELLNGNISTKNIASYLDIIQRLKSEISGLGRAPGVETFDLFNSLNKAQSYLSIIQDIRGELKTLRDTKENTSDKSRLNDLTQLIEQYKQLRVAMVETFNNGKWNQQAGKDLSSQHSELLVKTVQYFNEISTKSAQAGTAVENSTNAATEALKKEEQQAKKTAEAIEKVNTERQKKPAVMKEAFQENAFTKAVDKIVNSKESIKEVGNDFAGVKKNADDAKGAIESLKTSINEILNAFRGSASKTLGVGEAGEKGRQYVDILAQANKKLEELSKKEGGDKLVSQLKFMIDNAQKYLNLMQQVEEKYKEVSNIRNINPNVDSKQLKEALGVIENFRQKLLDLESGRFLTGVDKANVLSNYQSAWKNTITSVKGMTEGLKVDNTLSDLKNKSDKANSALSSLETQIEKVKRSIDFGKANGYNTDRLFDNLTALNNRKAEFERVLEKDTKRLNDATYMNGLYSETQKDLNLARNAMKDFGNVVEKVKSQEKGLSDEYDRKKRQSAQYLDQLNKEGLALQKNAEIQQKLAAQQEKAWISQTKSGFRGGRYLMPENERAAQGYRDIAKAYQTSANQLQAKYNEDKANFSKQLDEYAKLYKTIEDKLRAISPNMDGRGIDGKGLKGKDRSYYEGLVRDLGYMKNDAEAKQMANISDLEAQAQKIKELIRLVEKYNQLAESASKATYKPYNASSYEQKRVSETAALKNAIIERAKAEEKAEKDRKKNAAEAKADEKQRQNEIEITKRRIQSLTYAMEKLQGKVSEGQSLKVDTSKAEAKVKSLEQEIQSLRVMQSNLEGAGWKAYLGDVGQFGNGRSVREANHLAQEQAAANREAQKGIEIEQKRQAEIAKSAAKVQSDLVRGFERANNHAGKLNSTVQDLKSLFLQGGLVFGAQQFAMSIITTGGEMEKQHIALQSILGDMQNANTMFNQIKELALNSPFTFSELNRDVKQLAAYGVEYDQLYDTTKRLADMSSGLGVSFDRIALAFGQVQARGWLDGKELRQIAYAGIPLLNKLSEFYSKQEGRNVSTSEIKTRISNRDVSFDDVKSIFWQMTNEGGQFYNMQQTLSETLLGRYNKLKDAWEIMLADFANGNSLVGSFFKTAIEGATALVQSLHSLAMPVGTIFAGYVLKKMLAGNTASSFLSNKANIASNIESRVLQGQQVSQIEQRILATKNQIAGADLRALANAKALTTEKLNQLRLSGQITAEQYNTYRGIVLRQTGEAGVLARLKMTLASMRQITATSALASLKSVWPSFATSALASFRIIGTGIKSMASTVWTAIGGLPGLIVTALTLGITSAISSYQELSQKIKQTQDEIADKNNQISKFLQDNNVAVTIAGGDTKEIDNMIDSYKDKLKELAPYSYKNMLMTADEKKSHVERLKYLEQEVKLLREANDVANSKMSNRGFYSDLEDVTKDAYEKLENRLQMRTDAMAPNASQGDKDLYANEKAYGDYIEKLKDTLEKKFGDIGKDEKIREAAMQSMNAIFSEMGVPEDKAEIIRSSVLQAFGCGEKSTWLQSEVSSSMIGLIDKSFPMIGEKIKASLPLTEAEQAKVKELMKDAKNGLINQYPELEQTLKRMLAESNFEAVIKLVFDTGDKLNDVQSTLVGRIPSMIDPNSSLGAKYRKRAEEYGKDNSWYKGSNLSNQRIDDAKNEWQSAVKRHAPNVKEIYQNYLDEMTIARTLLYNYYKGEGKKSNKPGKKNSGGRKEDTELKNLQERLNSLKSARQMYQKYQTIMSDDEAKEKTLKLFPEVTGLNLNDYQKAVRELLKGFKINTSERKKFQTSIYREVAEWIFSEKDKKAFDEKAATFNEEMNKLSERWDLYKTLLEKTGNKNFAESSWIDAFQMDEKTKSLMDEWYAHYGEVFNLEDSLKLTDGQAKERFKKADQYNEWKKIVDLLRGNYKDALTKSADIIEKALGYEEQIVVVTNKYKDIIDGANKVGNTRAAIAATQQRDKEIGDIKIKKFKESNDYLNFYGAIYSLGTKEAQKIAKKIRENLNKALADGSISAREYGKEIEALQKQLQKLSEIQPSFLHGGLNGIVQGMKNRGSSQMAQGQNMYDTSKQAFNIAQQLGDANAMQGAQKGMDAGQTMSEGGEQLMQGAGEMEGAIAMIDTIIHGINDMVQGMNDTFQDIKETADALGYDTTTDDWSDAGTFFSSFSNASNSATKGWDSLKEGNIGGVISGVVGSWTGWIKGYAQGHDQKLDNQIKIAERQATLLKNISDNTKSVVENTLGGIYNYKASDYTKNNLESVKNDYEKRKRLESELYGTKGNNVAGDSVKGSLIGSAVGPIGAIAGGLVGGVVSLFSDKRKKLKKEINKLPDYSDETYARTNKALSSGTAYDTELASLMGQRDMLKKQREDEAGKKKSDADKLADYDKQIEDMRIEIDNFAKDFLKDVYSIDMKSWASELTDTVVSAWEKGEDAVDAYRDKVKDMVKDVTKNIVTQKIMENALSKPLSFLTGILEEKGKLDETDMNELADQLFKVGDEVVPQITGVFEALKNKGLDLRENGSSSTTNSIKGITEETADLLASYLNSVRLDVSAIREMQGTFLPEMSEIAKSQLTQLNLIAQNTLRNADAAERIETIFIEYNDNFNRVLNGTKSLKMK